MTGKYVDGSGLVDSESFPVRSSDLNVEWLTEQATFSRQLGSKLAEATGAAQTVWSGLTDHYRAPEASRVYIAMDPVRDRGTEERDTWHAAAKLMDDYALELEPLRDKLKLLVLEVDSFRNQVVSGVSITVTAVERGEVRLEPVELDLWSKGGKTHGWVSWYQHQPTIDRHEELLADARALFGKIDAARAEFERQMRALQHSRVGLGQVGAGAPGRFHPGLAGAGAGPADVSPFAPSAGWITKASVSEVRDWWDGLFEWQRRALIAAMPMVIGNLNGVPLGRRAEANRINVRNEIARLEGEIAELDDRIDRASTGKVRDMLRRERGEAAAALASYRGYLDLSEAPGEVKERIRYEYDENGQSIERSSVNLVAFDPAASSIATYYGPFDRNGDIPDWVENVAVHTPGTTTRMDGFHATDEKIYNLYDVANAKVKAGATAWIAWAGGTYPQTIPEATSSSFEEDLGPKLHQFVEGVGAPPASDLTVMGHSYGGTVVASAEQDGLAADRILYVSSAGLGQGVDRIKEFPETGATPHYSMMARNDGVVGSIQKTFMHGASPLYDDRSLRVETGFQDATDLGGDTIEDAGVLAAHSAMFAKGSTAFNNMIGVVTGTQVVAFAPDQAIGNRYGGVDWVAGIDHPDYEPTVIDIDKWENHMTEIGPRETS